MRLAPPLMLVVLLYASAARAADPAAPIAPPPAPQRADAALHCQVSAAGLIFGCIVLAEAPTDKGLGLLAVALVNGIKTTAPLVNGKATAGQMAIPVCFNLAGPSPVVSAIGAGCVTPTAVFTQADVQKEPSQAQMERVYPPRAQEAGVAGSAVLRCAVTGAGKLADCVVISQDPPNEDFGAAALHLTSFYALRPKLVDGYAVAGTISLPINFTPPNDNFPPP